MLPDKGILSIIKQVCEDCRAILVLLRSRHQHHPSRKLVQQTRPGLHSGCEALGILKGEGIQKVIKVLTCNKLFPLIHSLTYANTMTLQPYDHIWKYCEKPKFSLCENTSSGSSQLPPIYNEGQASCFQLKTGHMNVPFTRHSFWHCLLLTIHVSDSSSFIISSHPATHLTSTQMLFPVHLHQGGPHTGAIPS